MNQNQIVPNLEKSRSKDSTQNELLEKPVSGFAE